MRALLSCLGLILALLGSAPSFGASYVNADGIASAKCQQFNNQDTYCSPEEFSSTFPNSYPYGCYAHSSYPEEFYDSSTFVADVIVWAGTEGAHTGSFGGYVADTEQCVSLQYWSLSYTCNNGSHATSPSACNDTNTCAAGVQASLNVKISGPNPSSGEYASVCMQGCEFSVANAQIMIDRGESPPQFMMVGAYESSGGSCGGGVPTIENDEVEDPTEAGETTSENDPPPQGMTFDLDAMATASEAQRAGTGVNNAPHGVWHALPAFVTDILTPSGNCEDGLGITFAGPLSFIGEQLSALPICSVQTIADTYGNWFMWFSAIIWSWAIVVGRSA